MPQANLGKARLHEMVIMGNIGKIDPGQVLDLGLALDAGGGARFRALPVVSSAKGGRADGKHLLTIILQAAGKPVNDGLCHERAGVVTAFSSSPSCRIPRSTASRETAKRASPWVL